MGRRLRDGAYIYENAVSPHLAAHRLKEGNPVEMKRSSMASSVRQSSTITLPMGSGELSVQYGMTGPKSGEVKIFLEPDQELNLPPSL